MDLNSTVGSKLRLEICSSVQVRYSEGARNGVRRRLITELRQHLGPLAFIKR